MPTRRLQLPPPCVVVKPQLHAADCGLAVLAMALGLPYEQVFQAAPLAAREGLTPRQLQAVATKLGARLLAQYDFDHHDATGIYGLDYAHGHGHWAYLLAGSLIDPSDGTIWDDPDTYLAATNATNDCFFVVKPALQHGPRKRGNQTRRR